MNITTFIDTYWMLPERTKKWLINHPERFEEFVAEFEREPLHYLRELTWPEIHAIEDAEEAARPVTRIYQIMEPPTEAIQKLGAFIAETIYESAQRDGFMRKYLRKTNEHTVPECTPRERSRVFRILRRIPNHNPFCSRKEKFRSILHTIRQL